MTISSRAKTVSLIIKCIVVLSAAVGVAISALLLLLLAAGYGCLAILDAIKRRRKEEIKNADD